MSNNYIPKCIKSSKPCEKHIDGSYYHHSCGKFPPKQERDKKSPEQRKKISERNKLLGIKPPPRTGCIPWNKGLKGFRSGENSHLWKGGLSQMRDIKTQVRECFEYRQWRSDIFTRDNFKCVLCGQIGHELNADHIKPFSQIWEENNIKNLEEALLCSELWNINNGRTLCRKCHLQTETFGRRKYGKKK